VTDTDLTTRDLAGASGDPETTSDGEDTRDVGREPLLPSDDVESYRGRWETIQASFVDEPREAVHDADRLVADLMQRLAATFAQAREGLESQWDSGDDVSTEDLRVALTRYRSFFDRLLSA
jgi:hypothetical protein